MNLSAKQLVDAVRPLLPLGDYEAVEAFDEDTIELYTDAGAGICETYDIVPCASLVLGAITEACQAREWLVEFGLVSVTVSDGDGSIIAQSIDPATNVERACAAFLAATSQERRK